VVGRRPGSTFREGVRSLGRTSGPPRDGTEGLLDGSPEGREGRVAGGTGGSGVRSGVVGRSTPGRVEGVPAGGGVGREVGLPTSGDEGRLGGGVEGREGGALGRVGEPAPGRDGGAEGRVGLSWTTVDLLEGLLVGGETLGRDGVWGGVARGGATVDPPLRGAGEDGVVCRAGVLGRDGVAGREEPPPDGVPEPFGRPVGAVGFPPFPEPPRSSERSAAAVGESLPAKVEVAMKGGARSDPIRATRGSVRVGACVEDWAD
jgi:hypothetical protein